MAFDAAWSAVNRDEQEEVDCSEGASKSDVRWVSNDIKWLEVILFMNEISCTRYHTMAPVVLHVPGQIPGR